MSHSTPSFFLLIWGVRMSVLRYPGGKSLAIDVITPFLPQTEIYSPFFGGGSVELYMAQRFNTIVHANDVYVDLIKFWKVLKSKKRPDFVNFVKEMIPFSKDEFLRIKQELEGGKIKDVVKRAATFFVLSRSAFNGDMFRNGYSTSSANSSFSTVINRLNSLDLTRVTFTCSDFESFLKKIPENGFIFADPPYALETSYMVYGYQNGTRSFDHVRLRDCIVVHKSWVLCYNDCNLIRDLYKGHKILKVQWYQAMSRTKSASEILIMPKTWYTFMTR